MTTKHVIACDACGGLEDADSEGVPKVPGWVRWMPSHFAVVDGFVAEQAGLPTGGDASQLDTWIDLCPGCAPDITRALRDHTPRGEW